VRSRKEGKKSGFRLFSGSVHKEAQAHGAKAVEIARQSFPLEEGRVSEPLPDFRRRIVDGFVEVRDGQALWHQGRETQNQQNQKDANGEVLGGQDGAKARCAVKEGEFILVAREGGIAEVWKAEIGSNKFKIEVKIEIVTEYEINSGFINEDGSQVGVALSSNEIMLYVKSGDGYIQSQSITLEGSHQLNSETIDGVKKWAHPKQSDPLKKILEKQLRIAQGQITCFSLKPKSQNNQKTMLIFGTNDSLISVWESTEVEDRYHRLPFINNPPEQIPVELSFTKDCKFFVSRFQEDTVKIYRRLFEDFVIAAVIQCTSTERATLLLTDIIQYLNGCFSDEYNEHLFSGLLLQDNDYSRKLIDLVSSDKDFTALDDDLFTLMNQIYYENDKLECILKAHIQYNFILLSLIATSPDLIEFALEKFGIHTWLFLERSKYVSPVAAILYLDDRFKKDKFLDYVEEKQGCYDYTDKVIHRAFIASHRKKLQKWYVDQFLIKKDGRFTE